MPEAEDVITDAARHATVFVQNLWQRHRAGDSSEIDIPSLLRRIELLLAASFPARFVLRRSQPPAPTPLVRRLFARDEAPPHHTAVPATDGVHIWLPLDDKEIVLPDLQVVALQQAMRATSGATQEIAAERDAYVRAIFEVLTANAADVQLARLFPGTVARIETLRRTCLRSRPSLSTFPASLRALETWVRHVLATGLHDPSPETSIAHARALAKELGHGRSTRAARGNVLYRDGWTGELCDPPPAAQAAENASSSDSADAPMRSAQLPRRPKVRAPDERDEQSSEGAWMVQTAQPHEHAEDPFGLQRPTDRDEKQAAEELADSVSEMMEARLVSTPDAAKEVLLSDDAPTASAKGAAPSAASGKVLRYPEWDCRRRAYRHPGAAVHVVDAPAGPREWVERTLDEHRALLQAVRRQFESLRARRVRLRQQFDGDELDLQSCLDAAADLRAGTASERGLYESTRNAARELAVLLLIDVSGSTDGWISQHRRVIDVEREALLLVCLALDSLGEPYSVLAFSGMSAERVTVRSVKTFAEAYGEDVGLRIAGLEPERYTRAGAAIRHASSLLMREPARHRLLLLLTDGKPNDVDEYDGRYGVEDMRQAIVEARLQGIYPFCLTVDRQTASYLPGVFGEHQYAVLHRPDALPTALLHWIRRLVQV